MYNTRTDIQGEVPEEVLVQLTDDNGTGVVEESVVTLALVKSAGEVDGYCASRYVVPFAAPPAFVKALDLDIAIYHLFSRRENVPENRKERYKNAVRALERIARGEISIGAPTATPAAVSGENVARLRTRQKQFDEDTLSRY